MSTSSAVITPEHPEHAMNQKKVFGQPIGLYILFFTELWERFSYYGMRGLLTLYLISSAAEGGFGWSEVKALGLYGTYTMMVYVTCIPGGVIADKWLGRKKTVFIGGLLLVAGHLILAIPGVTPFYTAITLIIAGVGLLKANISTMVGGLYKQGDENRDKGFNIFYMGINIGAALASLIVGYVGETIGWHYGFGLAGIGMVFGQIVFMGGQRYLKGVGEKAHVSEEEKEAVIEADTSTIIKNIFGSFWSSFGTVLLLGLSVYAFYSASYLNGALLLIAAPFLGMGIHLYQTDLNDIEKDRIKVILVAFLLVIAFWGAFEQAGGLMNIFTKERIDRSVFGLFSMTAAQFQFFNPAFIILFSVPVAGFWIWYRKVLHAKSVFSLQKMAVGNIIMGLGFVMMVFASINSQNGALASMWWVVAAYLLHTLGELSSSPVALSFITKLSPERYGSIMMGLYFAMTGLGNKLAGEFGSLASSYGDKQVFMGIFIFSVAIGFIILLFKNRLKKLTHGAEDVTVEA